MTVAKQLYQLQEVDLELESNERALERITSQLGESQAVIKARNELARGEQHLEELRHRQNSVEWDIENLATKLTTAEEKLYSGRVRNPKELTNLQHEIEGLKARLNQQEDKALEIMEQVAQAEASVATTGSELKKLEDEWRRQQSQLADGMKQLEALLSDLKHKRQQLLDKIDPPAADFYHELRKQKGQAVAKVEQGVCRGCRISLATTELQQARTGSLVQCSNCGRILFIT